MTATATNRATGLHHFGVTVSDLDRSARFYEDVFDVRSEWELEVSGEEVSQAVRVEGADVRMAFLRLPNAGLELLEYRNPGGRTYDRRNNDVGAAHLCLEVADIGAAYERLQARGAECYTTPQLVGGGALAGYRFFFFEDPDGLVVELLQPPAG